MLGSIVYVIACAVIAGLLASALIMVRPIKDRDETKPWRTFIFCYILVLIAPYGYFEVMTKSHGLEVEAAVKKAYSASEFNGPLKYFKITKYGEQSANVTVVGTDNRGEWGNDSPIMTVKLAKDNHGHWYPETYKVLISGRLNSDNLVIPPFF